MLLGAVDPGRPKTDDELDGNEGAFEASKILAEDRPAADPDDCPSSAPVEVGGNPNGDDDGVLDGNGLGDLKGDSAETGAGSALVVADGNALFGVEEAPNGKVADAVFCWK